MVKKCLNEKSTKKYSDVYFELILDGVQIFVQLLLISFYNITNKCRNLRKGVKDKVG